MNVSKSFSEARSLSIGQAAKFAAIAHKDQKDHSGIPYIWHPARVAANLKKIAPDIDDEVVMAAWLHDVIEDCDMDDHTLRGHGFSERTVNIVLAVTKPKNDPRMYDRVIDDLIATENREAMLVKMADNMDNLHPLRVAELAAEQPEKSAGLVKRYQRSLEKLSDETGIDLNIVHDFIAQAKPIGPIGGPKIKDTAP